MQRPSIMVRYRRWFRAAAWALFLLCVTAASTFFIHAYLQRQAAESQYYDQIHAENREGILRKFLRQRFPIRSDLERELLVNGGHGLQTTMKKNEMEGAIYKEGLTGAEYWLVFKADQLIDHKEVKRGSPASLQLPLCWRLAEGVRQYVGSLGLAIWVAGLLILCFSVRRPWLAEVLLGFAIVCVVAWQLRPAMESPWAMPGWFTRYWTRGIPPPWFQMCCWDPPLILQGVLLVGTAALVAWMRVGQRKAFPHCGQCGYNLTANVTGICPECGLSTSRGLVNPSTSQPPVLRLLLLHTFAIISLVMCASTITLWIRSHNHWDWLTWKLSGQTIDAYSADGCVECRVRPTVRMMSNYSELDSGLGLSFGSTHITSARLPHADSWPMSWGFDFRKPWAVGEGTAVDVPHWFLILAFAALPTYWVGWFFVKRRRAR